ncbi:TMF-regulated nuclear protein 1 [Buteo buteo]|uniref:TMF-regulated nuclear protein 1 n=1 Tax=Buteo buteo TaxID=30397 RepID=UPI003EB99197
MARRAVPSPVLVLRLDHCRCRYRTLAGASTGCHAILSCTKTGAGTEPRPVPVPPGADTNPGPVPVPGLGAVPNRAVPSPVPVLSPDPCRVPCHSELYRARCRYRARCGYRSGTRAGAVPAHTEPEHPPPGLYRTGPGSHSFPPFPLPRAGAEPVPEPPPAGPSRPKPAPPPGYISSPLLSPVPVPMAAAAAAAAAPPPPPPPSPPCPAADGEQRPDHGGPTTTGTGTTGNTTSGGNTTTSNDSPGSVELAAARRRLVAAEGRRRAAAELEGRVRQVHCALRHAELRLAARAEALGRLGAGVAQAQLALAAQSQRLQKGLRRRPRPRPAAFLAAARALRSCVPWAPPARSRGAGSPAAVARRLPAAPRSPA